MFPQIVCLGGGIGCLTFLNCVFSHCIYSNVWSKCLLGRMQDHTRYIFFTFLQYLFQMCPQMAWPRGCKVTQVAFVRLFSIVLFQRSPQIACPREGIFALVAFFCISPLHRSGLCICRWIFMWKAFSWRFFFKCTVKLAAFKLLKEHSPLRCIFFFHILAYYSILGIVESEALTVLRLITFLSSWSRRARIFCPQNAFLRKYFITWVAFYRTLGSDLWVWLSVSN